MLILVAVIGIAFAAFCIWVLMRIINRRENSDNELLVVACIAVLLLLVVIAPPIGLYLAYQSATRPKGVAKTMAAPPPPPVRPSGR